MGRIAIFREKHGNMMFDIDASGGWERVCMYMFLERDNAGYYYPTEGPSIPPEKPPKPSEADLSDSGKVEAYSKALKDWPRVVAAYREAVTEWKLLQSARDGNILAARDIIESRERYEYEGYYHEHLIDVADDIPRWVSPSWIQVEKVGKLLERVLRNPEMSAKDMKKVKEEYVKAVAQTTKPLPKTHRVPPEKIGNRSWEEKAKILRAALQRVVRGHGTPHDMNTQDSGRRVLQMAGYAFDGVAMERKRLEKYGSVEATAQARFESRFPPMSKWRKKMKENGSEKDELARFVQKVRESLGERE